MHHQELNIQAIRYRFIISFIEDTFIKIIFIKLEENMSDWTHDYERFPKGFIGGLELLDSRGFRPSASFLHLAYVAALSLQAIHFVFEFRDLEPLNLKVRPFF